MPARPFTPAELLALESHLLSARRFRDRMLLVVGTNLGYRITELLTLTVGQVLTPEGDVAREVTVARALLKFGRGVRKRSVRSRRVALNEKARGAIRDYFASLDYVPPGRRIPLPIPRGGQSANRPRTGPPDPEAALPGLRDRRYEGVHAQSQKDLHTSRLRLIQQGSRSHGPHCRSFLSEPHVSLSGVNPDGAGRRGAGTLGSPSSRHRGPGPVPRLMKRPRFPGRPRAPPQGSPGGTLRALRCTRREGSGPGQLTCGLKRRIRKSRQDRAASGWKPTRPSWTLACSPSPFEKEAHAGRAW